MSNSDLAVDLTLVSIDRIIYLREQIELALTKLEPRHPARAVLERALAGTDVGKMKVWQPGQEPF